MSLRVRLLVGVLALFLAALGVVEVVTYLAVRDFLVARVDSQLDASVRPAALELNSGGARFPGGPQGRAPALLPPGTYLELRNPAGQLVDSRRVGFGDYGFPPPVLPATLSVLGVNGSPPRTERFDVGAQTGGTTYRVLAAPAPDRSGTVVLAVPLNDVQATLSRLRWIEIGVSAGAALAVFSIAFWLIRTGLRPLDRMAGVAEAVAAGDLSRRMEGMNPRTEIGRLAADFNHMFERIEAAFREKSESEERLRRFVADASHELRTPLTSIRGYAELAERGGQEHPEDTARALQRIDEQSRRMSSLVEDLLTLARLDQHPELQLERVDLAGLAREAVDDNRVIDTHRRYEIETWPAVIDGDPLRLRQVISNLLANARMHTPVGTTVWVHVSREGEWAVLEVADNGPGLSIEAAEHAFERFYRADKSRSRALGGSGLGLSIVNSMVEAHGGKATAGQRPGGGALFRIELPARAGTIEPPRNGSGAERVLGGGTEGVEVEERGRAVD